MHPQTCKLVLFLVANCLLLISTAQSSAIKGQPARVHEEPAARTVRLAANGNHLEKMGRSAPLSQPAPVLESSKKIYNDESLRRQPTIQQSPVVPVAVVEPAAAAPVASVVTPIEVAPIKSEPVVAPAVPVAAPAAAPVPVSVQPQQPAASVVVPVQPQPVIPVAAPSDSLVAAKPEIKQEIKPVTSDKPATVQVEAKSAPVEVPKEQPKPVVAEPKQEVAVVPKAAPVVVVKKVDELPAASERSAPIKVEESKPSVVVAEAPIPVPVPVPVAKEQPVVRPVVSPVVQSAPVAELTKDSAPQVLQAKKDEPAPVVSSHANDHIEVPAPDPGLVLSEPIDSATKLLIDLDEHVQKFLPAEDKQEPAQPSKEQVLVSGVDYSPAAQEQPSGKSGAPLVPYSSVDGEPIVPPLPSSLESVEKASGVAKVEQTPAVAAAAAATAAAGSSATRQASSSHHGQNQQQVITQLLDQLDSLQNRIQDTINQLVARRRYVMSALLRPMGTYVRRVRTNLERLQNRVNQLQAAAVSVGGGANSSNQNRPSGFVDAAAIETIRRRIDDISKRISDIVNRIRLSLTPTSAPLNNNGK